MTKATAGFDAFKGRQVLLTGHTGFKGVWMTQWLLTLGAKVTGYALPPAQEAPLFTQTGVGAHIRHLEGDVGDRERIAAVVREGRFDFVFHFAAQPLVRAAYTDPWGTFATNVMGTAAVLEAVRLAASPCVVVIVTTDKCYENREWVHGYREEDPLGGHDPYSASKAAAELVTASWRRSFFQGSADIRVASARAGNVIGPGDWAVDRIVPDTVRALQRGQPVPVRNRVSTRPWQHVLEPLAGYLTLAAELATASTPRRRHELAAAFNFGPPLASNRTVEELVKEILQHWPGTWEDRADPHAVHEAGKLNLATDKAFHLLGWQPRWSFAATVAQTVAGYRRLAAAGPGRAARDVLAGQIAEYEASDALQPTSS